MLQRRISFAIALGFVAAICSDVDAQNVVWEATEVFSSADGSSQFVQYCVSFPYSSGGPRKLAGRTLVASNGSTTHSFEFPSDLPGDITGSGCFLVGTQGFADLNFVKPDFVVPNGFLFAPNGSVTLSSAFQGGAYVDVAPYRGLPTDGATAIDVSDDARTSDGNPRFTMSAVAKNFSGASYTFLALSPFVIGPGITGAWYDPAQSGQGLFIEVLAGGRFYTAWFAFNPTGTQQVWFTGVGTYSGNTASITAVEQPTGGRWIPNFDPSQIERKSWGTLAFTFVDCDHGTVNFNSALGYGAGSMNLTRLTQPAGLSCP